MANFNSFSPIGATKTIAGTTASAGATFDRPNETRSIRVVNASGQVAFIRWGAGAQTAVITDLPLGVSATEVFEINPNATHVAVILAAGSGNVYVTEGQGA